MPDVAQIAYEAYCKSIGVDPNWEQVGQAAKTAWNAVAQAVMDVVA